MAALLVPASASALSFKVVNESGEPDSQVYVDIAANGAFEVPGWTNDEAKALNKIPGGEVTIEKLVSGRVYISYGAPVHEGVPFNSPTRFDWAEMTVTPAPEDVANLTAVDQFAIGMRLSTFNGSGEEIEAVGSANSDTVFNALQQIPGGPESTIRSEGKIVRVLSPLHSTAYPLLGDYVRSLAGQTITLHTAFFSTPFVTSEYSGTFQADGSIALHGTTNPFGSAPETIELEGARLIDDIYTGDETPNTVEGTIRRDLLAGFSTGLWGGRYGNDALGFCSDAIVNGQGSYCPHGFNRPAFGEARAALSPFPTCEQYAAVINQFSDVYGNPYSDASKKVAVALDQSQVKTLQLTIQPDSGNAMPSVGGNPNCGAGLPVPSGSSSNAGGGSTATRAATTAALPKANFKLSAKAEVRVKKGRLAVGTISCAGACGKVETSVTHGKAVLARGRASVGKSKVQPALKLTAAGRHSLAGGKPVRAVLTVKVTQPGAAPTTKTASIRLLP
ncbi:MAG: hypothetical protein BGO11_19975 [Solirubrobacterales bacterium 70-9]|nr:MAG: hypothetical protein BGO11_19975 [Solirubrobacterales bacterium 70-9]